MRSWFTVGVYTSLAVSLNKLFHSHGEEGSSFFLVAVPADFSQRETFINRMSKRELSNNFQAPQFINLSCLNFFFFSEVFFFCFSFSCPALLCFTLLCLSCSCADLLLCSLQLCLSCLECLKQLVGNWGILRAVRKTDVLHYPHQKEPLDLSKQFY